jgi:8-oxo-dGTP pyrophosphatase MutT (NUDIX family)
MADARPERPDPGREPVEVVGADGTVERIVTRAEMRSGRLRHRSVYVTVRRPGDGAVLAHRRAAWKDIWPARWDLAFGGVCGVGEAWPAAAARELAEEAGIAVGEDGFGLLGQGGYDDDAVSVVAALFEVTHPGPFTFADGEVDAVDWVPAGDVWAWTAGRSCCPDTLALLRTIPGWPGEPPRTDS